jgi:hypothetical protein
MPRSPARPASSPAASGAQDPHHVTPHEHHGKKATTAKAFKGVTAVHAHKYDEDHAPTQAEYWAADYDRAHMRHMHTFRVSVGLTRRERAGEGVRT